MSARNRSPLGFLPILWFHLCILATGILLQNVNDRNPDLGEIFLWSTLPLGALIVWFNGRFLWDVFRSFKSAGVLITLLVLSCILGTIIIQDLDLRRQKIFAEGERDRETGLPPFKPSPRASETNKATQFALAQASLSLEVLPDEEWDRRFEATRKVDPLLAANLDLRRKAFGEKNAAAYKDGALRGRYSKEREQIMKEHAKENFSTFVSFRDFCKALHLTDIFEAWWFHILLGLIAVNVIVGTFARAPWNVRDMGIAVTHAGIITVLAGALLDWHVAREGYMYLVYGKADEQTGETIEDAKNQLTVPLPWRVHLKRFRTEYYHDLVVQRFDHSRNPDGTQREHGRTAPLSVFDSFAVRAGVTRLFEEGKIKLTVEDYKPRVHVRTVVEERKGGPFHPAVSLALYRDESPGVNLLALAGREPWFFAADPERSGKVFGSVRFEYVWARDDADFKRLLREPPIPDNGVLVVRHGNDRVQVPIRLGRRQQIQVGGRTVRLAFDDIQTAFDDKKNVNLDDRLQKRAEPELSLLADDIPVRVPRHATRFVRGRKALESLSFGFRWQDPRDAGLRVIWRVVGGEGRDPHLVQLDSEERVVALPLGSGRSAPVLGTPQQLTLRVERSVRSAMERRVAVEVTDHDFLTAPEGEILAAWGRLRIEGPWGTKTFELTPFDRPIAYGPPDRDPMYVIHLARTKQARDWFSVLEVLDSEGKVLKSHAVQVNSPLRYAGYRFFQATAGEFQGFGVSGISVTYNPGVNFMYVGYVILTFGVTWIFFVKPVIVNRQRRRRREEREAAA